MIGSKEGRTWSLPGMTPGRAALVALMDRYRAGLLDPFVAVPEVHKLMYFMQEAGEPLSLRLIKGADGPWVENLNDVLNEIDGHFISGYGVGRGAPDSVLELLPGAVDEAKAFLAEQPDTRRRFEQVSRLVEGFESAFGLELLATVHWVQTREDAGTDVAVFDRTYAWGESKRRFSRDHLRLARRVLAERGRTIRADG